MQHSHDNTATDKFPARSVWDVKFGDPKVAYWGTGHSVTIPAGYPEPTNIAYALNAAVERGKTIAQAEMRAALGLTYWRDEVRIKK